MTWPDDLRDASFRGKPFHVKSAEGKGGRRVVVHDMPGQTIPVVDDMGGHPFRSKLSCYCIGDDYLQARDELRRALNEAGPGTLIHPYHGELQVVVDGEFTWVHRDDKGRYVEFSIPFVQVGETTYLQATPDTAAQVAIAVTIAEQRLADDFAKGFNLVGAIDSVVSSATFAMQRATATINGVMGTAGAYVDDIAALVAAGEALADAVDTLVSTPLQLAQRLTGLTASVLGAVAGAVVAAVAATGVVWDQLNDLLASSGTSPAAAAVGSADGVGVVVLLDVARTLLGFESGVPQPAGDTPQQQTEADALAATDALVQAAGAVAAVGALSTLTFGTTDQAEAVRDELADALQTLAENAGDGLYEALKDLRVAWIAHVNGQLAQLDDLVDYEPVGMMPSLVLAHQLYGTAKRELEIVRRNAIAHPAFVPGGTLLKVVRND